MSALTFLSVSAAADERGFHPLAVSCLERHYRTASAIFEERDGWRVPVSVPDQDQWLGTVGLADLSHLAKVEVRPSPETVEGDAILYRISPRRALVLGSSAAVSTATSTLNDALTIDMTGALGIFAIVGPEAEKVLRRLTHLHDLPKGGEVAHVQAHVLPVERGYWIVFAQELGHYLFEVALDRASALGGGPIGVDAQ